MQRHVSALRSQLDDLGVPDPGRLIQSVPGGYRLGEVTTDLEIVEGLVQGGSVGIDIVRWWDEPLIGAPWESTQPLRSHLTQLATQALLKWSDALPVERESDATERAEHMLAHTPECVAAFEVRQGAQRRIREARSDLLAATGAETLREVAGLWADGRGTEALDLLESAPNGVPADLARRLCRAFIWLDPQEPWVLHNVCALIDYGISNPAQHERAAVTLDARVLEERADGQATARAEVEAATTEWELVRALRVEFMLSLSAPLDASQHTLVEQLSSIDHPDAQVESRRFRFISHLRAGDFGDACTALQDYADGAEREWPGAGDDFAPMARAALQRSVDPRAAAAFGPTLPQIEAFAADRLVLTTAQATRRLMCNDPSEPLTDTDFHLALGGTSQSARHAMQLLRDLNAGRPVEERAHGLAEGALSVVREKQFMMLPIALCLVAEALRDRSLADLASAAMLPWAGQMLGMWPVDAFFGAADEWLERLAAV